MPELPEVEVVRRQLVAPLVGRRIVAADGHPSPKFAQSADVVGSSFRSLDRRGKYLIAGLDCGRDLIVHLGMSGRLLLGVSSAQPHHRAAAAAARAQSEPRRETAGASAQRPADVRGLSHPPAGHRVSSVPTDEPAAAAFAVRTPPMLPAAAPDGATDAAWGIDAVQATPTVAVGCDDGNPVPGGSAYLRAWWQLDDGSVLAFHDVRRFGRVAVCPRGDYRGLPSLAAMGPEPLDPQFDTAAFWAATRRSTQRIKTQLLNQRLIAGVGNIYADESLFLARINPAVRSVSRPRAARLLEALRNVLTASIERGGSTLRDYYSLEGAGDNQQYFVCYGRAGLPCVCCGTRMRRRVLDQRSSTWCPTCQSR